MANGFGPAGRSGAPWIWFLVAGIVVLAAGIVAIFHPFVTNLAGALLLGAALVVAGAASAFAGLMDLRARRSWLYVLLGVLGLVAGLIVLFNPLPAMVSLVWFLGAWLLVGGAIELFGALSTQRGRWWLVFVALVDIVLGAVLLFADPFSALALLGVIIGLSLTIKGVGIILFSLALRRFLARPGI